MFAPSAQRPYYKDVLQVRELSKTCETLCFRSSRVAGPTSLVSYDSGVCSCVSLLGMQNRETAVCQCQSSDRVFACSAYFMRMWPLVGTRYRGWMAAVLAPRPLGSKYGAGRPVEHFGLGCCVCVHWR